MTEPSAEQTRDLLDRTAGEERYGDGFADGYEQGRGDGETAGFADGYRTGFDAGAEVGAERLLLGLKGALGEELIDALLNDAEAKLPHTETYRERTTYTAPEGRPEWRGTDNGDRLPEPASDVDQRVARIDQRRAKARESGNGRGMEASA